MFWVLLSLTTSFLNTCLDLKYMYIDNSCCEVGESTLLQHPNTKTLKMTTMVPLSGPLAQLGPFIGLGAQAAINEINKVKYSDGSPVLNIEYFQEDSGCNPVVADASLVNVIDRGTDGIIGMACSGVSMHVLPTVIANKIMMISPSNTAPSFTTMDTGGYYARTALSDALQSQVLSNVAFEDGHRTASILYREDVYGTELMLNIKRKFEEMGGTILKTVSHSADASLWSSINHDALVTELKDGNPSAVFATLFPETACDVLPAAKRANLLQKQWYLTDGVKDSNLTCVGPELDGIKGTAPTGFEGPAMDRFKIAYKEASVYFDNFIFAPQAYDAAMLMAIAALQNDELNINAIRAASSGGVKCIGTECIALAAHGFDVDYQGASGDIRLDENGDPTSGSYEVWSVSASSVFTTLKRVTI